MPKSEGTATMCLLEKPTILDKKVKRHSIHGMMEEENVIRPHQEIAQLSLEEKKFLLAVERGDVASTRRMLQRAEETNYININCVDPLGRSALLMAIDNENLEMVELLIEHRVETKDALLHAISEEFVEAVEVLLDHEETIHKLGEPHSWEALPPDTATFTPDITPLILSAHRDNYEIIKILLDRGATLPMPHDVRCGCDECVTSRMEDSLRHSRSRINAYRALASPSLIALSSKDPILTAFELSWELRRLSFLEHEFKLEYQELRKQCQDFATALLDHTRSSYELEVLLNHDPTGPAFEHGERMHLNRLKLAIKLRQKKDIFIYIVDNKKNVLGKDFCASIFQDFECQSATEEWSITIHEGNTTEKLEGNGEGIKVLQITDVHYDPLYKAGSLAKCTHPMCCNIDSGDVTKPDDSAGYWTDYNKCDLPEYTILDTLNQISKRHNDIDYVYFTGDIINHKVWDTNVGNNTRAIKTILNAFADAFGDIPVFPILGNHEPHPINVWYPLKQNSGQWLFDLIADQWGRWLPKDTKETILKGGYYTVLVKPGFRIIAINSNVAYSYNWWLVYDPIDPFGQLQWMENVLYEAEQNRESVHILSHVPSGDDTCNIGWGKQFTRIVKRYSNTITGIFNGHTHYDEFIIYYKSDDLSDPINIAWNGASLTPFSNNNPNYRIYSVDSKNYDVLNFEQWIFNITEANLVPDKSPNWFLLYNFLETYEIEKLNPNSVSELVLKMAKETKKTIFEKHYRFRHRFGPAADAPCNDDCKKLLLCRLFVAHSNVQQLLASIWYEGLPGFRRKNMVLQGLEIVRIGMLFPIFSIGYIVAPHSLIGQTMRKPFIKFICHSASYFTFLFMLILASQRIETLFSSEASSSPKDHMPTKRGSKPSLVEWIILSWVSGLIWSEIKQLWDIGLEEYVRDMWNVIDFITNSLYVATVALRIVSYYQVQNHPEQTTPNGERKDWDAWDPMLISEGLFSAANIFSSLKLVYIFSVNPHLGPLQVSLSRMVMDIMKFFFLYVLVLFAFSCGLNQLLWYYAEAERDKCPSESGYSNETSQSQSDPNACFIWRRFANLFETSQTLFWAVFGLIDLESFDLNGIKIFTRFWGMLMFGTYSVINIVVLLNLLIATMNHSYQLISERADVEWKFARSKLWISYFEEGGTAPPPFNIIPTPKSFWYVVQWLHRKLCGHSRAAKKEHMRTIRRKVKQASERDFRYQSIMRNLVRRYVTVEQRKAENQGVTEDDVNEIKQDISAFRFELIEILKNSGMNTSTSHTGMGSGGKKNRQKERRLMKGFNIAPQPSTGGTTLPPVAEFIASLQQHHEGHDLFGSTLSGIFNSTPRKMHQRSSTVSSSQGSINEGHHRGRCHIKRTPSHKRRWGTLIEAAKAGKVSRLIGRSRSEDSVCNSHCQEGNHNHSHSHSNSPGSEDNCTESATDSNPSIDAHVPHTEHFHGLSSGLALLKKKRKKFSASRNTSPVVVPPPNPIEHAIAVCVGKSNKKVSQVLKRASSVPTRVPEVVQMMHKHEQTQSQQDSVEIPTAAHTTLTPSTTEESVNNAGQSTIPTGTSSREPLLYNSSSSNPTTGSSQTPEDEYKNNGQALPKLPGVIPLSGHNGPTAGWL